MISIESRKESQKNYYLRIKAGYKTIACSLCGARLKVDSRHSPICWGCWYKTEEGRLYLKEKQQKSRAKKKKIIEILKNLENKF
jgi:hypothetical protein